MSDNLLRCETCQKDVHEVHIFEKPLRFAFRSDIANIKQINPDGRKQDNICLECFEKELHDLGETHETKYTLTVE